MFIFALRKLVLFDIFLSCLPRRRPGEVRARQGRRYWRCRHPDLIRKCPDFPRKSPDSPRFSPVFPRNPPDFPREDLRLCGLPSQKSGLRWPRPAGRLFALPSLYILRLEVCLRLGSFFRLSRCERFRNSLLRLSLCSFFALRKLGLFDIFCVIATKILRRRFRRFLTTNKHKPTRTGFGFMGHFANGRVRQSHQLCSKQASVPACDFVCWPVVGPGEAKVALS